MAISCATEGATVYYTIDGSEPSAANGRVYAGPFAIYETTTVKAIAVKDDWKDSAVASATFEKSNKLSEAGGLLNYLPESDGAHSWSAVTDDSHDVKDAADVRLVVFEDGVRSFANVIVPEAFADGTEENVGDGVSANATNTVSWRVSEDWNIDLAKVKVEVLVKPSATYLPFRWVTIPGRNGRPTMKVSTNETDGNDLFNALLWCVADKDAGLVLVDGVLKSGDDVLVSGTELTAKAAGFVFGKMGYGVLEGDDLEYVRGALRKPLKGEAKYSRYAVMVVGE